MPLDSTAVQEGLEEDEPDTKPEPRREAEPEPEADEMNAWSDQEA